MFIVLYLLLLTVVGCSLYLITSSKLTSHVLAKHRISDREKAGTSSPKNKESTNSTLSFPPSRRHALQSVLMTKLPEPDIQRAQPLPDKQTANQNIHQNHLTATGITLREIQRVGDFPDYATLSGIPLPSPYPKFDITTAMPRPYRPFRWAYHQTMSLQKLEPDWWLELDHNYTETIRTRRELYEKEGPNVLQVLPGSELAAKELMEMCLQFLCARYPHYFHLSQNNTLLHNQILHTQTNLRTTPPLLVLLHNIPEDFAIMLRDPETGLYIFRAGIIMSSLGWSLGSKISKPLHEIHDPVPDYKEKMKLSMDRYFAKMPTDKPIQRGSWGIEVGKPLFVAPESLDAAQRTVQNPAHRIGDMHLRVDWQTLRRLPLSGAIVFNFKALFTPVAEFRDEAYIPTLVLKVLREGKQSTMDYKATWHTEHVVIPALEAYEKEQIEKGLVERHWQPQTLQEAPFFPGWEEKWHRQQGF